MHIPSSLALTFPLLTSRQVFEAYDACAEICFEQMLSVFATSCTETVYSSAWIACICGDANYAYASAGCIYKSCGATILNDTASKHEYNCNLNNSPPAVDAQQFVEVGDSGGGSSGDNSLSSILSSITATTAPIETAFVPSTSTRAEGGSTPTTTIGGTQESETQTSSPATSSSASSSSGGNNTLSTGALVGSIVGSITGAIGSFAGVYFGWKSYKIRKEEKKDKEAEGQGHVIGE